MNRSLGHLSRIGSAANRSNPRAAASPTRSDNTSSPEVSVGRSTNVSHRPAPGPDAQLFPPRPRPAVCSSAMIRVPAGAPSPARRWATSRVEVVDANNSTRGNPSTRSMSSPVAPSNSTSLPTSVNHRQDSETEYDTIEREYPIAMTADIPHQNRNRQPAGHRRRHDAGHQLIGESAFVQSLGTFEHH